MTRVLALVAATLVLAPPVSASRVAVGVAPNAARAEVADQVAAATGGLLVEDLGPLDALVFDVPDERAAVALASALPGVEYAEALSDAPRAIAFTPNDPLAGRQWYLGAIRAFDFWPERPDQPPVLVAVVDSGLDGGHPEFAGRVAAARSFVSTPALEDASGHGTMVAGEIAAALDNAQGIAGVGVPARLLVAKVVKPSGEVPVLTEVRAIRWAVDRGARVINLSLGGRRDPRDPSRDTYSRLEHAAIEYATRRGAVVVAAVGNCAAFACPERYASWPAALPHVVGVGAVAPSGAAPSFSNRDRRHVDLAAPGLDILTTYPLGLSSPECSPSGYTVCADRAARRRPAGTSFAAPLASAAAAVLLGEHRLLGGARLHPSQVTAILERSADDVGRAGRDPGTGNGQVDVDGALRFLSGELPPRDRFEANDDAGARAFALPRSVRQVRATLDRWNDARDVYRIRLGGGRRLTVALAGPRSAETNLFLWRPGTASLLSAPRSAHVAASVRRGSSELLRFRARRQGSYFLEVRLSHGRGGAYRLTLERR